MKQRKKCQKETEWQIKLFHFPFNPPQLTLWKISGGVTEAQYINTTFPPAPYMAIQKGFFFHLSFIFEEISQSC